MSISNSSDTSHDLDRLLHAQKYSYDQALLEIRSGQKRSHWMWYVFPQLDGLAFSSTAKYYSIKSIEEATAYLDHAVLGARLLQCTNAVLQLNGRSAKDIFGFPDDMKLRSCATLFAHISPSDSEFDLLLQKYYQGERDEKTLELLNSNF